jgi:predicted DNA-binding ribbon-helix-helix protein
MAPLAVTLPECGAGPNESARPDRHSALVDRNVKVHGRRTSVRLEPQIWDRLAEICRRESCTPHQVCSFAADRRLPHGSLASSLRVVILDYFHSSATEDGHRMAGHGQGMFLMPPQLKPLHRRTSEADRQEPADGSIPSGHRGRSGPGSG